MAFVFHTQNTNIFPESAFSRYDVRAGFWGVTGQPCLGIIPVRSRYHWFGYFFFR